jgi:predicted pyridoxine 5'-phosphate oxidase superfamily flavin-nucleotide-binding protein
MNYAEIAFSDASKRFQERYGSRASYARMEQFKNPDGLTEYEMDFISHQDNFYMATNGKDGFPYIQFRGGPKGFLKVLDDKTLGFVDFGGNKQYISVGNLTTNNKVALFLLDQAAKARLKIYAEAEILEIKGNTELFERLELGDYKYRPERMIVLHVKAYDWNCPQHITERYTLEEISEEFLAQHEYIDRLRAENERLKAELKKH